MTRAKRTTLFIVFLSVAFVVGLEASARTERFRWTHPDAGAVDRYYVYYGTASRVYGSPVDAGTPATDSEGAFVYDLEVPDAATIYVAVTAWVGGLESDYSNERTRSPSEDSDGSDDGSDGSDDGGTLPPASSAIDHFELWNAETDAVIDSDFTSGDQIDVADYGCTAIEVVGNDYLRPFGSPGSIQFDFDGETPSTCSEIGLTHDNDPPYAWESASDADQFDCSTSLTELGSHTLTVTPYDGNDCSGSAGPSVMLSFDVVDSGASGGTPPADQLLGKPGRPTLVGP